MQKKNKVAAALAIAGVAVAAVMIAAASLDLHFAGRHNTIAMLVTSPSFEDGGMIPKKFTCDGGNINPELILQNVPDGAESIALILHDPDAPRAGGFTHWVVWNIDPSTTDIKQESVPPGSVEGRNDGGQNGYGGPCPPSGQHHYAFRFYALDAKLDLPETTGQAGLEAAMGGHILEEATLTGLYQRQP